jgi:hypothetical protein
MDKWLMKQVEAKALLRLQELIDEQLGDPTLIISDFWNGYWRRRAQEGFFDDIWAEEETT